jgi:hypothetical protein
LHYLDRLAEPRLAISDETHRVGVLVIDMGVNDSINAAATDGNFGGHGRRYACGKVGYG